VRDDHLHPDRALINGRWPDIGAWIRAFRAYRQPLPNA
jgi:hypothetical protein